MVINYNSRTDKENRKFDDDDRVRVNVEAGNISINPGEINIGKVEIESPRDIEGQGQQTIGTSPIPLVFSGVTQSIIITADINNTGLLFIGKSNVNSSGANAITYLEAGDVLALDYDDSENALYVVADTASQNYWLGCTLDAD